MHVQITRFQTLLATYNTNLGGVHYKHYSLLEKDYEVVCGNGNDHQGIPNIIKHIKEALNAQKEQNLAAPWNRNENK